MKRNSEPINKFMKFLRFPLTRILLGFLGLVIVATMARVGTETWPGHKTTIADFFSVCIAVIVVIVAYYGFVRLIERRALTELSFPNAISELAIGVIIGSTIFSITIGILWAFGFYRVSGVDRWTVIIHGFILAVFSGVFEELLIRGILFRIMEESLGTWLAMAISALIFGALHLINPNATLWGAAAIAIEAGIPLAAAFVSSRRLWIPIGIHFAWNFTQGSIFSVAVSGGEVQGLLKATLSGPVWLSGGAFGAEASVLVVVISLGVGIYFLWRALEKEKFIKPFWKQRTN